MYIRKTEDEFDIEGDYGQGFEVVTCETTWRQAIATKKDYRVNEPGIRFRIVHHRVKKDPLQLMAEMALAGYKILMPQPVEALS